MQLPCCFPAAEAAQNENSSVVGPFQLDARCHREDTLKSSVNATSCENGPVAGLIASRRPIRTWRLATSRCNAGNEVWVRPLLLSTTIERARGSDPVTHENDRQRIALGKTISGSCCRDRRRWRLGWCWSAFSPESTGRRLTYWCERGRTTTTSTAPSCCFSPALIVESA